jgi:Fe-S-cluster containining protein
MNKNVEEVREEPAVQPVLPSAGAGAFEQDLLRGLVYAHNRANANTAEIHQANATLHALVELLVDGGLVNIESLNGRREQASEQLRRSYLERGMAVAMQEFGVSKYEFKGGAEIDCASRLPLCKAACCRLPFALSKEDVQEGIVKWDLGQPYLNARDEGGYCRQMDRGTCRCTVYEHRPIPCRGYDCRNDKRIWVDFENRVINPRVDDRDWPECFEPNSSTSLSGEA